MYLKHFGLYEPPFKITPVTSFFFSGANRGEILDALIYAIAGSEGIIKVTGEVGSGKTMLCRMLLERLPLHVEPVYLANPSLSREEMLYAIADSFHLNLEGQRVNIILQTIQNLLEKKLAEGKRVVILVDEAHAMPLDTLEELRLIYNMQVGDQKLLQIVLVGQPELNEKLDQPNMRQLKDRIIHHFTMRPIDKGAIEAYLMFRLRTAGFRGSNIFSAKSLELIDQASQGLLRRINVLADKSLLSAFVEDANTIEEHHVQEAIRDSDLSPKKKVQQNKLLIAGVVASVLLMVAVLWLVFSGQGESPVSATPPAAAATPALTATNPIEQRAIPPELPLVRQRLDATRVRFAQLDKNSVSIQLFYTENINPANMERFLERAQTLGILDNLFVFPVKIKDRDGFRVLYGIYPNVEAANNGMQMLPQEYRTEHAPTLYLAGDAMRSN